MRLPRIVFWTCIRMNAPLMLGYAIACVFAVDSYRSGDTKWAALFAILGLMAMGIETKFRNPASVAIRQLRSKKRRPIRQADPSRN